jgi:hypothetical protein
VWVDGRVRSTFGVRTGRVAQRSRRRTTGTGTSSGARFTGVGEHRAVSRVRLHPAFSAGERTTGLFEASNGPLAVRIIAESPVRLEIEQGRYFPRFGVEESCLVVRLEASGPLPLRVRYRLELETRS